MGNDETEQLQYNELNWAMHHLCGTSSQRERSIGVASMPFQQITLNNINRILVKFDMKMVSILLRKLCACEGL